MKGFVYFIIAVIVLTGGISAFWWLADGSTLEDQLGYLKDALNDTAASNAAESASKLGEVLKNNFDEAKQVYEQGAEVRYE